MPIRKKVIPKPTISKRKIIPIQKKSKKITPETMVLRLREKLNEIRQDRQKIITDKSISKYQKELYLTIIENQIKFVQSKITEAVKKDKGKDVAGEMFKNSVKKSFKK